MEKGTGHGSLQWLRNRKGALSGRDGWDGMVEGQGRAGQGGEGEGVVTTKMEG